MGANAARWNPDIQRAFYNSWKSINGLKHQTIDIAHGFCIDIYGPTSLRRHELTLYRARNINSRVAALQLMNPIQFIIIGDSAYVDLSHTRSYITNDNDSDRSWNRRIKRVRVAIETFLSFFF